MNEKTLANKNLMNVRFTNVNMNKNLFNTFKNKNKKFSFKQPHLEIDNENGKNLYQLHQ